MLGAIMRWVAILWIALSFSFPSLAEEFGMGELRTGGEPFVIRTNMSFSNHIKYRSKLYNGEQFRVSLNDDEIERGFYEIALRSEQSVSRFWVPADLVRLNQGVVTVRGDQMRPNQEFDLQIAPKSQNSRPRVRHSIRDCLRPVEERRSWGFVKYLCDGKKIGSNERCFGQRVETNTYELVDNQISLVFVPRDRDPIVLNTKMEWQIKKDIDTAGECLPEGTAILPQAVVPTAEVPTEAQQVR
jgi:hypothetical protein